jgi:hypothetical protein
MVIKTSKLQQRKIHLEARILSRVRIRSELQTIHIKESLITQVRNIRSSIDFSTIYILCNFKLL